MKNFSEIYSSGEKFISSKQAAILTGYANDYIGQLCRLGKIKCQRVGRDWMISERSILNYKNGNHAYKVQANKILSQKILFTGKSRLDDWDKALFENSHTKYNFDLGYLIRPLIFTAVFMVIITGLILNLGAISKLEISLPKIEIAKLFSLAGLDLARLASLPRLPFTWEDSKLAVLDLKNRFLENLLLWKDYLASLGRDIKIIAQDFLSTKPTEVAETPPPDLPKEGSKIITFGDNSSPQVKEVKTIVERVLSGPPRLGEAGISQADLDQKLSQLNDSILLQIKNSLALIEKRLPSNQVQNPVVFLTTSVPGPQQAGGGSPPQTGSGISASFGDFSSGISTGGNLTASGNIILGQDTKTVGITSNTWKITSAGAASGLTSLTSTSLNTGPITASSLSVSSITSTGNTGIGTTSPGALLSVAGTGLFSFLTSEGLITSSYFTATSSATSTIPKLLVNNIPSLAHLFSTWVTGNASSSYPDASLVINPSSATADSNLFSLAVGSSVKALIDAEGDLFVRNLVAEGSVTQGATTLASLSVEGNSTFGDAIGDAVTFNAGSITYANRATTTIPNLTVNAFSIATSTSIVPTFTISTASSPFGLVGIGTTSPGSAFSVQGNSLLGGALTAYSSTLGPITATSTLNVTGASTLTSASTTWLTASSYFQAAGAGGLNVLSSGLTGFGTTSPSQLLSVQGNGLFSGDLTLANLTATGTANITGLSTLLGGVLSNAASSTITVFNSSDLTSIRNTFTNATSTSFAATGIASTSQLIISNSLVSNAGATSTFAGGLSLSGGNINLPTAGAYLIANARILDSSTLGSSVATSSLTAVGYLTSLNINGNIGVGTTTPGTKLEVVLNSSGATADQLYLSNQFSATSTASRLSFRAQEVFLGQATTTGAVTGLLTQNFNVGAGNLIFSTLRSGLLTEAARILDTGFLGIATSTPAQLFSVQGNSLISGTLTAGNLNATNTIAVASSSPAQALSITGSGFFTGGLGINQSTTTSGVIEAAGLILSRTAFANTGSATSTFTQNGINLLGGCFSITGACLPQGTGTAGQPAVWSNTNDLTSSSTLAVSIGGTGATTFGANAFLIGNGGGAILGTTTLSIGSLQATTTATSYFIGSLGIGTSTPASKFSVQGDSLISGLLTVGTLTSTSTTLLATTGGNVGIGTTSPKANLEVAGTTAVPFIISSTNVQSNLQFKTSGTSRGYIGYSNVAGNSLTFSNSVGDVANMVIQDNGNVGIGTTSPASLLSVQGNSYVSGTAFFGGTITATSTIELGDISDTTLARVSAGVASLEGATISLISAAETFSGVKTFTANPVMSGAGRAITFNNVDGQIRMANVSDPGWGVGAIQFNASGAAVFAATGDALRLAFNVYHDSVGNNRYINTDSAAQIAVGNDFNFSTALSGTAGNVITFTTRLVVTSTGNVGIGTTTPAQEFAVAGDIYAQFNGGATAFGVCHTGPDIDAANAVGAAFVACTGTVDADYAELYPTEAGIDYGEIVTTGDTMIEIKKDDGNGSLLEEKEKVAQLVKSSKLYQSNIIGITSNNYGDFSSIGHGKINKNDNPMPVALVGRVPVKVNLEGGVIAIGDKITSSSVAGVGMKATASGQTVGIALEPFSDAATTTGKVLVFVNLGYSKLDSEITQNSGGWIVDQTTGRVKTSYALDMDGKDIVNARKILSASGLWSIDENGKLVVQELSAQKVSTQQFCLGETCINETEFKTLLQSAGLISPPPPPPEPPPDILPPTITILGNNPAVISVGAAYADPGVTVTDNVDQNLGYTASLDGGPPLSQGAGLTIDTSMAGEHTILYSATDNAGNTATATRTVQVF